MLFFRTGPNPSSHRGAKKQKQKYNNGQVRTKETDAPWFKDATCNITLTGHCNKDAHVYIYIMFHIVFWYSLAKIMQD